ncbi:MAG TPA: aromatic amino acid ammonia-lyase [Candidatus Chromulinivoraceae bacterium]|nr:aromatic amino acid ammonia-lyase [Candidatus Chromulinivoraceae bacterium]
MTTILLSGTNLTISDLDKILSDPTTIIQITPDAKHAVDMTKEFIDQQANGKIIYGINTGFGPMASHIISEHQQLELQRNLIRSHAVGVGDPIKSNYVLAAMVVRLNTLLRGYSGVSFELVERLQMFINHRILPIIPEHGAVGTSGDLVQLAHIALAVIGEGEVLYDGQKRQTQDVLTELDIPLTYQLKPKEGLALINGTAVMTGIVATLCVDAKQLLDHAIKNGAFSLELVHAYDDSISEQLHALRPHAGQKEVARRIRELLKDSYLLKSRSELHKTVKAQDDVLELPQAVQEVYSLRCIPQILGPIHETLTKTIATVEIELNAVTDNPIVDRELGEFIHGGNFHGDYIASAIDQLKAALVKLTMLSERRVNFFLNKNVNKFFPPFLNLKKPGLTLGLQGMQFVATSTTAQSQSLAYPHHLHSIPTNGDNQDVVSMGTDAALLAAKVVENAYIVVAIERITLAQAVDFTKEIAQLSQPIQTEYRAIREVFPAVIDDRAFSSEINNVVRLLKR